jgi:hypothetical protein
MRKLLPSRESGSEVKSENVFMSADSRTWHKIGTQQMTAISVRMTKHTLI